MRPILKFALIIASLALAPVVSAAERPNAGGPPEQVDVVIALLDVASIDDKAQRFTVDLFFQVSWTDTRLIRDDASDVYSVPIADIWTPSLTIMNDRGTSRTLPEVAEIDADGKVTVRQRLSGELAVRMDLSEFPFDQQLLPIEIVSYRYSGDEVEYSKGSFMKTLKDDFSAGGWKFGDVEPRHSILRVQDMGDGAPLLVFAITAEREAVYYLLTLMLPMLLVLSLAWLVHWVPHGIVPARIGMSTASVFSLMALGISMRLSLPKISYLTHMDIFIILSTLLVLTSLAVAVACTRLTDAGRDDDAFQLSRRMRIGYPIVFGLIVLLTLAL